MKRLLASLLVLSASGCPDVTVDQNEVGVGPTVEFDPARSLATGARFIPFPTDLVRNPVTGKISLSSQACETPTALNTRINILNTLDGFGTYQVPIQVTFTEEFDEATVQGNVALFEVTSVGPSATPLPIVTRKTTTVRFASGDCSAPETVHALVVIPTVPLKQRTTYVLAVKEGIRRPDGGHFGPSLTWALVSSKEPPVTLDAEGNVIADSTPLDPSKQADRDQLRSLLGLWKSLERPLIFLDQTPFFKGLERSQLLVATSFTTQTTTATLDPTVAGSPAAELADTDFLVDPAPLSFGPFMALCVGGESAGECAMKLALGGCAPTTTGCGAANYVAGNAACAAPPSGVYDCAQVGNVLAGAIGTTNYQRQLTNPTSGLPALQGAWTDPYDPTPSGSLALQTLVFTPTGAAPAEGWPVVIFGHGLTSSKESAFAIAGKLARAGFATVAIDMSQHGSRAVRTSTALALGCKGHCYDATGADTGVECDTASQCDQLSGETCGRQAAGAINPPSPSSAPQCYASIFSADLTNTRDNIRQSILDFERVAKAVKACGTTNCGTFQADPDRIFYGGISLGSLIGGSAAAISPDIQGAALNVGGVGWLDVIENTMTVALQCSLVNSLVDAGIIMGEKWTPGSTTDVCTTGAWKTQPGYATFSAVARWVLDPADAANFEVRLRAKPHLIQSVIGDTVVPNIVQERQAALTGVAASVQASSPFNPGAPTSASAAISTDPAASKYVTYTTDANHIYVHSTLLRPAFVQPSGTSAQQQASALATMRMQIDFAQFLDNIDDDSF